MFAYCPIGESVGPCQIVDIISDIFVHKKCYYCTNPSSFSILTYQAVIGRIYTLLNESCDYHNAVLFYEPYGHDFMVLTPLQLKVVEYFQWLTLS